MKTITLAVLLSAAAAQLRADVVCSQPPPPSGGVCKSAWLPPDGLDGDEYAWDNFTLPAAQAIMQVRWRGGYTNILSGGGQARVFDFDVSIYGSIAAGSQPDIVSPPLVHYQVGGNAGETPAGTFGGVPMYDYRFTLPAAFQAAPGVKYWLQIEAWQNVTPTAGWPPDWSWAIATGGDTSHFQEIVGGSGGGGNLYFTTASDLAFSLWTAACYANCDGSTAPPVLNVNDFSCFLNRFAAGDSFANCDGSTTPPILNVLDFLCFLNAFAAGCS
jgi:hypothetical protein